MAVEKQLRMVKHGVEGAEFKERAEKHEVEPHERYLHEVMERYDKHVFNESWKSADHLRLMYDFIVRQHDEKVEAWRNNEQVMNELEEQIRTAQTPQAVLNALSKEKRVFNIPKSRTNFIKKPKTSFYDADKSIAGERYLFWTDVTQKYQTFEEYVRDDFGARMKAGGLKEHPFVDFSAKKWVDEQGRELKGLVREKTSDGYRQIDETEAYKLAGLKAISDAKAEIFENFIKNYVGMSHNVERVKKAISGMIGSVKVAEAAGHGVSSANIDTYLDGYQREVARLGHYDAAAKLSLVRPHRFFTSCGPDQLAGLLMWSRDSIEEIKLEEAQKMRTADLMDFSQGTLKHMMGTAPHGADVESGGLKIGKEVMDLITHAAQHAVTGQPPGAAGGAGASPSGPSASTPPAGGAPDAEALNLAAMAALRALILYKRKKGGVG